MLTTTIQSVMELGRLRAEITTLLGRHGVSGTSAADITLVVTELAVNGFEHAGASQLVVKVLVEDHDIVVELTHVGVTDLAIPVSSVMPDPQSLRHRGLAIVDSLATAREIISGPCGTIVRCSVAR